jgi:hypothetical protein
MRYNLGEGHALVGRSAPDFELVDGLKLAALLNDGKGILLDFDSRTPLRAIASRWGDQVRYVQGDVKDRLGLTAVFVRPDGVVAWACEDEPDREEALKTISRWAAVTANWSLQNS